MRHMPAAELAADIMEAAACAALTSGAVLCMPDVPADLAWRVADMDTAQYPADRSPGVFTAI